ncbi:MAG TPA: DUF1552 domain-containing protein [Polyangia bacterium]|nr:DUF1552 domain-containing protein [Polyangia bacterium]
MSAKMPTEKTKTKYSRRTILKALGLGAGFLPLISTERARGAAANGFPTRFISVAVTDGICPPDFYPTGAAGPLPATLPISLAPLAPWSSQLLLLRSASKQTSPIDLNVMMDLGATYGGHFTYPALLTGGVTSPNGTASVPTITASTPSIDQIFSDNLASTAGITNAQLNVGCRPYGTSTSWASGGIKNTSQTDPYKLFNSLFAMTTMPPAQVNALLARRKSVLDFVGTELTNFSQNLGTDDKVKVQSHLDSIRSLETQLTSSTGPSTATCTPPSITPAGLNFNTVTNYPAHVKFMADLVSAAVICGKARAVTMDLIDNGGGNSLTFPWINIPSPDMHAIAHQGSTNYAQKSLIDQWFYQQCVAELVGNLAAVTEGNGTVLDNTVILVMSDMSEGSQHYVGSIPYLLIGSGGGFFKTGRTVTFPSQVPNNYLLTSILHAMGMTDLTGVGDPKYAGNIDTQLTT